MNTITYPSGITIQFTPPVGYPLIPWCLYGMGGPAVLMSWLDGPLWNLSDSDFDISGDVSFTPNSIKWNAALSSSQFGRKSIVVLGGDEGGFEVFATEDKIVLAKIVIEDQSIIDREMTVQQRHEYLALRFHKALNRKKSRLSSSGDMASNEEKIRVSIGADALLLMAHDTLDGNRYGFFRIKGDCLSGERDIRLLFDHDDTTEYDFYYFTNPTNGTLNE